jgi:glycosyltransferase involved in cell wall biosynthesis
VTDAKARGTIVSLTPVALEADSRAFRTACTLADAGFRSIVVEGRASRRQFWDGRIEVRSLGAVDATLPPGSALRRGRAGDVLTKLRNGRFGRPGEAVLYVGFRAYDWRQHCRLPRFVTPSADLYYLHSFEMHRAIGPLVARTGARLVYDAHDFYREIEPPQTQRSFDGKWLRPFYDRLESGLVAAADAVVTVSDGVADEMARTFGRRPEVIRNCHDERHDRRCGPDLRSALGLAPADRLCVVVGNYKTGMAIGVAAAALARLPERFHFAFVGRGYETALATLPRDLLDSRLHIGRAFAPNEVVPAIRSADVGLVLYEAGSVNYRYALPNGFFQAVAAALPLVRAPLVEIENAIAGRAIGVCLERLDPAALATAILYCTENDEALRVAAVALARELRWMAEARRLDRLISCIMQHPKTDPRLALGGSTAQR